MTESDNPKSNQDGVEENASEFVGVSEEYRRYIQAGLDDVAAGRTRPWSEVREEWRAKFADLKD